MPSERSWAEKAQMEAWEAEAQAAVQAQVDAAQAAWAEMQAEQAKTRATRSPRLLPEREIFRFRTQNAALLAALKRQIGYWYQLPSRIDEEPERSGASPEDATANLAGFAVLDAFAAIAVLDAFVAIAAAEGEERA